MSVNMNLRELLELGLKQGLVRLDESPYKNGIVCYIGDGWFYFGGHEAETMTAEQYLRDIPHRTIMDEIYRELKRFRNSNEYFRDEYDYYVSFLRENLVEEDPEGAVFLLRRYIDRRVESYSLDDVYTCVGIFSTREKAQVAWAAITMSMEVNGDGTFVDANGFTNMLEIIPVVLDKNYNGKNEPELGSSFYME